jgi:hypothetical protein
MRSFVRKFGFAAIIVLAAVLVLILVNRAVYGIANEHGTYCKSASGLREVTDTETRAPSKFSTAGFCWASGLSVTQGNRYRITLTIPEGEPDWFDYDVHTDIEGYPAEPGDYIHILATPIKRRWHADWFKPIARIGSGGNEEYVLDPVTPLPPLPDGVPRGQRVCVEQPDHFKPIDAESAARVKPRAGRRQLISEIQARSSGELFLYVNDAALAIFPGWPTDKFYWNKSGRAEVTVIRLSK